MFVIFGLSFMTEVLSAQGAHGAEVLADMMRVVFDPLVNAVYQQGGFVIGFAGDAFSAVFPQDRTQLRQRCAVCHQRRQCRCIPNPIRRYPRPMAHLISASKRGSDWQDDLGVKSINNRRASYWFRGESLNGAVAGEESAHAGDIVAYSFSYELLKDIVSVTPAGNCFLIQDIHTDLPTPLPLSVPKPADDLVEIFLDDAILHLPAIGEFRQVVQMFIDIPAGISDEALIAPFMETVYLLQEQYGGFFFTPRPWR